MAQNKQDTTLPILAHILGLFTGFIGPLIILLVSKKKYEKDHSKHALNWQISLIIYVLVSIPLMIVLIGFALLFAVMIMNLVFCILAAVRAGDNILWKYPLAIPFLKVKKK